MKFHVIAIVFNFLFETAKSEVKYFNLRTIDGFPTMRSDGLPKPVTVVSGVSKMECGINCVSSKTCVSFDYNTESKVCRLNEGGLNTAIDPFPVVNGTRRHLFFEGLIGHYCDTSAGCVVDNSECRIEGVCGCNPGYSFQKSSQTCEQDCVEYGDTFQCHYGGYISGENVQSFPNTPPAQCVQHCIAATGFICLSFDTVYADGRCLLSNQDATTMPWKYFTGDKHDLYQRNCA